MKQETILITGANGQIGSVLTQVLREQHGVDSVIPTDIREPKKTTEAPFELLDVLDEERFKQLVLRYDVTQIYHLAAVLSASGEKMPQKAWNINMTSLLNVLELARKFKLKVFFPSSIAVFGLTTPNRMTPQVTITEPSTIYGISKVAGEHWCNYYYEKFGVDVRSMRYPGIIGYRSLPGGGTTDYAVEIYHAAVKREPYSCFLSPNTRLPMMFMDDAIRATIQLMETPIERINIRTSYNLAGMSFTPAEIAKSIQKHLPKFKVSYAPDFRQQIASTWVESIDDSHARADWDWNPKYNLSTMTETMLEKLAEQYNQMEYS
ncbi:MAG: NAD-dependent epimerase/dehydratase family protein [Saprospiraceae bacterium]